jgi:CMP-2-keto-3-deoxyoctulosonic acid synthetase
MSRYTMRNLNPLIVIPRWVASTRLQGKPLTDVSRLRMHACLVQGVIHSSS